jgi:fructokinase
VETLPISQSRRLAKIVVCGEALVDLVPAAGGDGVGYLARPGGSPANVAVGLGRLGLDVGLLTRLSTDHFGQLIRDHLVQSHVDLSLATVTTARTTVAMVSLSADGIAEYSFGIEGGADDGWRADELPPTLPDGAALHVSGALALAVPSMGATVSALLDREHGRRVITLDPNPRPALGADLSRLVERWLPRADIVKVSEEDLAFICPGEPVAAVARRWRSSRGEGPALVVVTRGADGVYALGPDGSGASPVVQVELAAPPVDLVDTVGAGDAFMAGLLAALDRAGRLDRSGLRALRADELAAILGFAQRVAAVTCSRVGADPPWRADLTDRPS